MGPRKYLLRSGGKEQTSEGAICEYLEQISNLYEGNRSYSIWCNLRILGVNE